MKELSLSAYLDKEHAFFKKHDEYLANLIAINSKETELNEKECEKERKLLKKKYEGYTDIYDTDFFTELNDAYVEKFPSSNAKSILKTVKDNKGKQFYYHRESKPFIINRAIVMVDDFYYEMIDKDGNIGLYSCVGTPEPYVHDDNNE